LKIKVTSITLYDGLSLSKSPAAQNKVNNSVTNQDVNYISKASCTKTNYQVIKQPNTTLNKKQQQ